MAVGNVFAKEQDKRGNDKAIVNRNILVFTLTEVLISLLLTDWVFQDS